MSSVYLFRTMHLESPRTLTNSEPYPRRVALLAVSDSQEQLETIGEMSSPAYLGKQ